MAADIRCTVDELVTLSLSLSSANSGKLVQLVAIYGVDGVNTGSNSEGDPLVFPITLSEGVSGVYYTNVVLESTGAYFAKFSLNGKHIVTRIIRVVPSNYHTADGVVESGLTILAVSTDSPNQVELTITDIEGTLAGEDDAGDDLAMPIIMDNVPGHSDSWFFQSAYFSEGGKYILSMNGGSGPIWNDDIVIWESAQPSVNNFQGWEPESAYSPSDWISIGYLRRWTGWSVHEVSNSTIKELRRLAVETFITETNRWFPKWTGTMYGIPVQGSRIYLPVPILTPQDGGMVPKIEVHRREGNQEVVETIPHDLVFYMTRGHSAKQPFIQLTNREMYDNDLAIKITADWGEVSPNNRRIPTKVKQVLVGLVRWHSLSFGQGPDGARDQGTANRTTSESTRDYNVSYHETAIGRGITGDPVVDRELARLRIEPPPWARVSNET